MIELSFSSLFCQSLPFLVAAGLRGTVDTPQAFTTKAPHQLLCMPIFQMHKLANNPPHPAAGCRQAGSPTVPVRGQGMGQRRGRVGWWWGALDYSGLRSKSVSLKQHKTSGFLNLRLLSCKMGIIIMPPSMGGCAS